MLVNSVELVGITTDLARLNCGLNTGVEDVDSGVEELIASRCALEIFWTASSICAARSKKPESRLVLQLHI